VGAFGEMDVNSLSIRDVIGFPRIRTARCFSTISAKWTGTNLNATRMPSYEQIADCGSRRTVSRVSFLRQQRN